MTSTSVNPTVDSKPATGRRRERRLRRVHPPRHTRLRPTRRHRRRRSTHRPRRPRHATRHRDPRRRHRAAGLRLLLDRNRHPARHHPASRPPTLGRRHPMTTTNRRRRVHVSTTPTPDRDRGRVLRPHRHPLRAADLPLPGCTRRVRHPPATPGRRAPPRWATRRGTDPVAARHRTPHRLPLPNRRRPTQTHSNTRRNDARSRKRCWLGGPAAAADMSATTTSHAATANASTAHQQPRHETPTHTTPAAHHLGHPAETPSPHDG